MRHYQRPIWGTVGTLTALIICLICLINFLPKISESTLVNSDVAQLSSATFLESTYSDTSETDSNKTDVTVSTKSQPTMSVPVLTDLERELFGIQGNKNLDMTETDIANFRIKINQHDIQPTGSVYKIGEYADTLCWINVLDVVTSLGGQYSIEGDVFSIRLGSRAMHIQAGAENAVVDGTAISLIQAARWKDGNLMMRSDSLNQLFGFKSGYVPVLDVFSFSNIIYETRVGSYKGRNVFYINNQPHTPLMYSGTEQGRKTWQDPTKTAIQEFVQQGYDIIQTDTWFKYILLSDGTFDMLSLRNQLAAILDICPEAKIVVRINVSAPSWWLSQHPTEICKITKPGGDTSFGGNRAESLASEEYRAFAAFYLNKFIQELEKTPEGNHVIGYHIGGGVYGEWHYYGIQNEADASSAMAVRFAQYAEDKYGSLDKANTVWKTSFPSADAVIVPSYEERYQTGDVDFRDPQQDQYVIDYYECHQETISSFVNNLARVAKQTSSRPVITGVFYGYFYGGFTVGSVAGQNDIETMFCSPYLDYFAGPYNSRDMNGGGSYRSLAMSVALNGKIWMTEHDGGTYLGSSGDGTGTFPSIPADEPQTIARMRRNFMYSITENGGQWWYDFGPKSQGGGWWSTPGLLQEARNLLNLSERLMEKEFVKPADVLLVSDMDSFNYMRPKIEDRLSQRFNEDMADAILGTGICYDKIFLMDLDKVNIDQYKLIIFGNTICLNDQQRSYIKNTIVKAGRTVVFMSGAGYTDGKKNDESLISDLTGITVKKHNGSSSLSMMLGGSRLTLNTGRILSLFCVEDAQADTLGQYNTGEVAMAKKMVNGCKVIYCGLPFDARAALYKGLVQEAEVRVYAENLLEKDYVSVGGGIIGIYSVYGGEKIIKPLDGSSHTIHFAPYRAYYFDIETGEQLNS